MDFNPLSTPKDVLTDCINGTLVTFNGKEFTLQNDMGNCKVDTAMLKPNFIPMGMASYDGIIYVASYNPLTGESEYGSFPSPQRDFSTSDFSELSPVEFLQSQFVLDNNITPQVTTNVLGKLFEPELFLLHPGDQYVVTYQLKEPSGGDPSSPTTLDTNAKYNNYISKDPTSRKLFKLSFYKIVGGTMVLLDPTKFNAILYHTPLEASDYAYFTENSSAAIAVGLEIETLDSFDANVVDRSLRTNSDKRVGIEALGASDSLSDFEGVRVDVTSPTSDTFYLQRNSSSHKVSGVVSGLGANDNFECQITPYSEYCLFPDLAKKFKVTMGEYLTVGSGVNNLFRFYLDPQGFMRVDFDYRFQGNSTDGIHLYVEFYDPWSNYSVVRTVDNPTYYGINSVIVDVINEPVIDQFDSTTVGGTDPSKLITNPDTEYESTLLNSTNLIRTNQVLRANQFYIVRISGVDRIFDPNSNTFTYTHYDFYKALYVTDMFNSVYTEQAGLASTDPLYVGDFTSLNFNIKKVAYTSSLASTSAISKTPVLTTQRADLTTAGQYYKVSPTTLSTSSPYASVKTYESSRAYALDLSLKGLNYVYGNFKTGLLGVTPPAIENSDSVIVGPEKPTIVDAGWDLNSLTNPHSLASWTLTAIGSNNYTLGTDLATSRTVTAPVTSTTRAGFTYAEVGLLSSLYYRPNGDAGWATLSGGATVDPSTSTQASVLVMKYDLQAIQLGGSTYVYPLGSGNSPNDARITAAINTAINTSRTYSAVIMAAPEPTYGYGASTDYNSCRDTPPFAAWKHTNLMLRQAGQYHPTKTIDLTAIIEFFTNLFVASNTTATVNVYYPNPSSIVANGSVSTTATFPDLVFTTTFTPDIVSLSYVKTYLSTFRLHATGSLQDFSADNINTYIAARQGASTILDGVNTIPDAFIPSITAPVTSTASVLVPTISITQSADVSIITAMADGVSQFTADPAFQEGPRLHGVVFTKQPEYASYTSLLSAHNVFANTPIVSTGSNAVFVETNTLLPLWTGHYALVGRCAGSSSVCPSLLPQFNIPTV